MDAAAELGLVLTAIRCRLTGCVLWKDEKLERRVRRDAALQGLTPNGIVDLLEDWVCANPSSVKQVPEKREGHRDWYDFHYDVLIPIDGFPRELYVELVLKDPTDPDVPEVIIVNAHLTTVL